jgi:uncharacterized membrane protein
MNNKLLSIVSVIVCLFFTNPSFAASFLGLGFLPGQTSSGAVGVSADGEVVVGNSGNQGYRWTRDMGMVPLGNCFVTGVSGDGSTVVGFYINPYPYPTRWGFRWREGEGLLPLGTLDPDYPWGEARAASYDGGIIVGLTANWNHVVIHWTEAFLWTESTGMLGLGGLIHLYEYPEAGSTANGISPDGMAIVGSSTTNMMGESEAFLWSSGMSGLGVLPGGTHNRGSGAMDVSGAVPPFGYTVVGQSSCDKGSQAFRWNGNSGMVGLGYLSNVYYGSFAYAISADASVIVGDSYNDTGQSEAFIWKESGGMRSVKEVLEKDFKLDLTGWKLVSANDVSADGTTIVIVGGGVNPSGQAEGWIAVIDKDTDGDGLYDSWEEKGIDIDGDGTLDLDWNDYAPNDRPNPMHKDLFVEVDILSGQSFPFPAEYLVEEAFRYAPVTNPDLVDGINLHIIIDERNLDPMEDPWITNAKRWAPVFDVIKFDHFGTAIEHDLFNPNRDAILKAKKKAFRYCIIADKVDVDYVGKSELPGNDFYTTMGNFPPPVTDTDRAATFMHELGHCLNLRHGGIDDINGKPNYISIMNYILSSPIPSTSTFWKPDYSRVQLNTLNESELYETTGITYQGLPYGRYWNVVMPFGVDDGTGGRKLEWANANGSYVNWNGNGILPDPDPVIQDLNYHGASSPIDSAFDEPSPGESMRGFDDWANLQYAIGETGDFAELVHNTTTYHEPTTKEIEQLKKIPSPFGPGDINADGQVNETDFALLAAAWLAHAGDENWNHACDIAKPADDTIDLMDLAALSENWME